METQNRENRLPFEKKPGQKFGLVLGGGGSKGCYHVGVWQAFNEAGITFDAVTGTSIGALVGIFYPGNRIETVTDFVMNMQPGEIAQDLPVLPVTMKETVKGSKTILSFIIRYFDSRMDITPLREHFRSMFDYEIFAASPVRYACMTYCETKKEPRAFFKSEITPDNAEEIVMASSACYPAFPKVTIGEEVFMDGMYADNVPIDLLSSIQPDTDWVAVVDLHDPAEPKPPALRDDMFYIEPLVNPGNALDFSRAHASRLYAQGYLETKKRLGQYSGYLYTFQHSDDAYIQLIEDYLMRQTAQMQVIFPKVDHLDSHVIRQALGYQPGDLPTAHDPSYEFGRYVEGLALIAGIDPIALRSYPDFLRELVSRLKDKGTDTDSDEYKVVELLKKMKREESISFIHRQYVRHHGKLPEKTEALKEQFPVSFVLGWIWYCLDALIEELDRIQKPQTDQENGEQDNTENTSDPAQTDGEEEKEKPLMDAGTGLGGLLKAGTLAHMKHFVPAFHAAHHKDLPPLPADGTEPVKPEQPVGKKPA